MDTKALATTTAISTENWAWLMLGLEIDVVLAKEFSAVAPQTDECYRPSSSVTALPSKLDATTSSLPSSLTSPTVSL